MSGRHGGGNRGGSPAFSNESVRGNGGHRDNFGGRASPANSSSRTPWSQSSPRSVPSRQAPTDQSEEIQAPGHRFQPSDLLALAALQADEGLWQECLDILETIKEVHRTTVSSARANSNELLLGSGSGNSARVSGGGSRGGLGGDTSRSGNGAGVAAEAGQTGASALTFVDVSRFLKLFCLVPFPINCLFLCCARPPCMKNLLLARHIFL